MVKIDPEEVLLKINSPVENPDSAAVTKSVLLTPKQTPGVEV